MSIYSLYNSNDNRVQCSLIYLLLYKAIESTKIGKWKGETLLKYSVVLLWKIKMQQWMVNECIADKHHQLQQTQVSYLVLRVFGMWWCIFAKNSLTII